MAESEKGGGAKKARRPSFDLSEETQARIKIMSGQGRVDVHKVVEVSVNLLYDLMPGDRDARVDLEDVAAQTKAAVVDARTEGGGE